MRVLVSHSEKKHHKIMTYVLGMTPLEYIESMKAKDRERHSVGAVQNQFNPTALAELDDSYPGIVPSDNKPMTQEKMSPAELDDSYPGIVPPIHQPTSPETN